MDAELLAEVYINMTRGQDALLIEAEDETGNEGQGALDVAAIDLRSFDLPVIQPTPEEAEAFDKALQDLDKASGGKSLWKSLETVL